MKLYSNPYSQHSRRVVSLLEIAGLTYESIPVNLAAGEHRSPEFLRLNPNHQVPVLIDGSVKIHESNAILRYLCHQYGLKDWYPSEPGKRALVDQWLDWNQCRLSPIVVDIVLNQVFLKEAGDSEAIRRGKEALPELIDILTGQIWEHRYLAGPDPTIADLSVASNFTQLGFADCLPNDGALGDWYDRILSIGGVRLSLAALAA